MDKGGIHQQLHLSYSLRTLQGQWPTLKPRSGTDPGGPASCSIYGLRWLPRYLAEPHVLVPPLNLPQPLSQTRPIRSPTPAGLQGQMPPPAEKKRGPEAVSTLRFAHWRWALPHGKARGARRTGRIRARPALAGEQHHRAPPAYLCSREEINFYRRQAARTLQLPFSPPINASYVITHNAPFFPSC